MGSRAWHLIDTEEEAKKLLVKLVELPDESKRIYLDFEGVDLCRKGTVAIGQLAHPGDDSPIYLLDFIALSNILEVSTADGISLRQIFEGNGFKKFIFDPRCDSDCLYHTKGKVYMRNVICLQLAEVAKDRAYGDQRRLVNGLKVSSP